MLSVFRQISRSIMQSAPLFPIAVGLTVGILLDRRLCVDAGIYGGLFVLFSAMFLVRSLRASFAPLLILIISGCLGGVLHVRAARTVAPQSVERHMSDEKCIARISGVVVSEPRVLDPPANVFQRWSFGSARSVFLLESEAIEGMEGAIPVTGLIRVTTREPVLDMHENERVEVFGWLYRLKPPRNPGAFDWAAFNRRQGVVAALHCNHRENVRRLDVRDPAPGHRVVRWLRTTVRGMLTDDLVTGADEEVTLLEAMVIGHRSRIDRRLNEVFVQAGVVHFLAVSGTHVVVVTSFVWFLGRLLRRSRRQCAWLMILVVCAYALIAEPRPPILRATVLTLLFCTSLLLGRPTARLNWLSAAAIVLLALDPHAVFDIGFQLSFTAVLGVAYVTPVILQTLRELCGVVERLVFRRPFTGQDRLEPDPAIRMSVFSSQRLGRFAYAFFVAFPAVSLGAWLASLPIVAAHFGRVHPWSPVSSVIVFPFMYVVMILGLVKILVAGGLPLLGPLVGLLLVPADRLLIRLVEWLSTLPGASLTVVSPPSWLIAVYYLCLLLFVWTFRPVRLNLQALSGHSERQALAGERLWGRTAWGVATAVLLVCVGGWYGPRGASGRLAVTVLSVGDGLATVVELPGGQTMLYDVGTMGPHDVGRNTVVPYLRHKGIARIDRVYLSHPNLDHFSGLPSVLEAVEVGPIFVNEHFGARSGPRSPSRYLLDLLAERDHQVEVLDPSERRWEWGGVTFELLSPLQDFGEGTSSGAGAGAVTTNDTSTVLRLTYAGRSVLLTGDIEEYAQRRLLVRHDLWADVLVLPHHGGVRPSSEAFVGEVGAGTVIRSSGEPMTETFNGLQAVVGDTPLYNTADVGAVRVVIDAGGVHVSSICDDR